MPNLSHSDGPEHACASRRTALPCLVAALALAAASAGCATGVETGDSTSSTAASTGQGGQGGDTGTGGAGAGGGEGGTGGDSPSTCDTDADCSALDQGCIQGICAGGTCLAVPGNEFGSCDDGAFCTENDICMNGVCVGGTTKYCPSDDACHIGVCDEATLGCTQTAGNDGAQCDDMDPCTTVGFCSGGACGSGLPIDCSIFDSQCTQGACDPVLGCQPQPANEGQGCDDGLFCNVSETCQAGICTGGAANPCAPPGGCYVASCDESADQCTAVPGNDGAACDDFSPCTTATTCAAGACINGTPANDGAACDDGTMCTTGEFCSAGVCGGGAGPQVYFAEDFHDNSKGWTLGPEWEIGPATMSFGGQSGADPDTDYSLTADDGVAGIVIGGNASTGLHPFTYLESPPFDTAGATNVILGFRRVLNSDYTPFMDNTIEVWTGATWAPIWNSGPSPQVSDGTSWVFIQHDLTAYKNPGMRIRFGMMVGSGGVYTIGSWNLDDILVAEAACP
jgi:hypothetical protein